MKFSIIIPAFNSEDYIHKALDSIEQQVFKDYEVIVVCDSCKDGTAAVARSYGAKVIEVDFSNEGPTRNAGIEAATGDWILFMDDDDWFMHGMVLTAIDNEIDDNVDVIQFGFIWGKEGYASPGDYWACWCKAYRREFVGDVRFSNEKDRSDVGFKIGIYEKKPRIKSIGAPLYYYDYMREGSVSWARGY